MVEIIPTKASVSGMDEIEIEHWARAQQIAERWRRYLHNLVAWVNRPDPSEEAMKQERVIAIINRLVGQGKNPTIREIHQYLRSESQTEIKRICEALVEVQVLAKKIKEAPNGRQLTIYEPY